jgi:cation diffusion facilitator CzcD-associated flavoprotein CzcO
VAPDLDTRAVLQVTASDGGFRLVLADGESFFARRVVMATGLLNHEHRPEQFDGLPRALVSHSCEHTDSSRFRGRRVAVIGRGQSACESAALLHEAGANVEIICRGNLLWNADPAQRSLLRKAVRSLLRNALIPPSQVGPFPLNWLVEAPGIIHHFTEHSRDRLNERCLAATAVLWLRSRLRDVPVSEGRRIRDARQDGDRIAMTLDDGSTRRVDHVLLATGYHIDVDKMTILEPRLRERIARHGSLPMLSAGFESSVSGLHFVGSSAVASFGPLLRFIAGAGFAARRITRSAIGDRRAARIFTDSDITSFRQKTPLALAAERERS